MSPSLVVRAKEKARDELEGGRISQEQGGYFQKFLEKSALENLNYLTLRGLRPAMAPLLR